MLAGFGAISLSILFFFILFKLETVGVYLKAAANTLMPFIIGCVMAYLIYPMSQMITAYLDKLTGDRFKKVTLSTGIFLGLAIFGVIIYFGALLLMKGIRKEDVVLAPKGEKIVGIMQKYKLL